MLDCITCVDSNTAVTQVSDDGTGRCSTFEPSEPGCYDVYGNLIPGCTCSALCKACGYNCDGSSNKDYHCITCADSNTAVTQVFEGVTGFCGSSQDNPCIVQQDALFKCIGSAQTTCPETYNFLYSARDCTGPFVARLCKIANGDECSTCATQMKEFLQCAPRLMDAHVKDTLSFDRLCWDSTVCGFSSSAGSAKFGSIVVSFTLAVVALLVKAI